MSGHPTLGVISVVPAVAPVGACVVYVLSFAKTI
jgi:hypothetical protein